DLIVLSAALLLGTLMVFVAVVTGVATFASSGGLFLHTAVALTFALPLAVRMLGRFVQAFLAAVVLGAAALLVWIGTPALAARMPNPDFTRLVGLAGFGLLVLILVPGRRILGAAIDRLVFHRGRLRQAELLDVVRRLSPELGIDECCR